MARTRPRTNTTERPRPVQTVDRAEQIHLLLQQQDAAENDGDIEMTVAQLQRQALIAPKSPLAIFRAWWQEEATIQETESKYWVSSDVISQLAVGDAKRLEELLERNAKSGWLKAARTFAAAMGWKEFPNLHIYAMFGSMLTSRQFMDQTRQLIGILQSRKRALFILKAVQRERKAGGRRRRNVNPNAEWAAQDATAALEEAKRDDDAEEKDTNGNVYDENEDEDEDTREDSTDQEKTNNNSRADPADEEEENNEDDKEENNEDDEENIEDDEENIEDDEEVATPRRDDGGHESESEESCDIEQGRGAPVEQMGDQFSTNDDTDLDWVSGAEMDETSLLRSNVYQLPFASRAKCTPSPASSTKPANNCTTSAASAITCTANHSSSRMPDIQKRELSSMPDNQPDAKRRLRPQLQAPSEATPPPHMQELESWLIAMSVAEMDDGEEQDEADFKVVHRDLHDNTAIPYADRTCIVYYDREERAAAAYVDHRTDPPVWHTHIPLGSALEAEAFEEIIRREFDGEPTVLDFRPAIAAETTDWSLVAVLSCLCMHRPLPDGAAAYPPIWQYALKMLASTTEVTDLDGDRVIATVINVMPSGNAVSSVAESAYSQPRSRLTSTHLLLRHKIKAVCEALRDKITLAKALRIDAALIASLASVALDRLGSCEDSDNGGPVQEQIESCKASLTAQRALVTKSAKNQSARKEVKRLEELLKTLEAQPVGIPSNDRLKRLQRHMQRLAGFILAREIEYLGELSFID